MNELISVIEDLIALFKDMIQIEQIKLDAAKKNRITHVEDCMKKEQAAILKLKGLEKKRAFTQEKIGLNDLTFQQILEETKGDDHTKLQELFHTLSHQVRLFQDTNESARTMIEINLHNINKAIDLSKDGTDSNKTKWEGLI